ncbi:unnamed protein product [Blepharisma stoltei]|uniref:Uncharacterized protein n=1 Tax=Blepharisma stoltei TaxID=1481888 RepID=A0AAU9INZ4_9CILI|nr:unnamed protein product [Blepharisma stoltei]
MMKFSINFVFDLAYLVWFFRLAQAYFNKLLGLWFISWLKEAFRSLAEFIVFKAYYNSPKQLSLALR